ncbi:hypothetical protein N0V86_008532 [Didymella sp. IMI 355093]|nr:hypothetical protein N0V86_008532 [Didymella sp. IMI 355093]
MAKKSEMQSNQSLIETSSAGVAMHLNETIYHIITCKDLEAFRRGEIGEQEALTRIAASLTSSPKHIVVPTHTDLDICPSSQIFQQHADLLDSRIQKGRRWLQQNARRMLNQIEHSGIFEDTFSQFLIMEATNDVSLLHLHPYQDLETNEDIQTTMSTAHRWNYFLGESAGTTKAFPTDVDSTSYSLLAFTPTSGIHSTLDDMLANRNEDGLVQTYWDPARARIDICVLANVARAFYKYDRGTDVKPSLAYISEALTSGKYAFGTRHYCTPEVFLFFMSHLVADNPHAPELQCMRTDLVEALTARTGVYEYQVTQAELDSAQASQVDGENHKPTIPEVDGLAIAMRVLACQSLEIQPDGFAEDVSRLASSQCEDGGWPLAWLCRYGRSKRRIGSQGVMTAYAVKALEVEASRRTQGGGVNVQCGGG